MGVSAPLWSGPALTVPQPTSPRWGEVERSEGEGESVVRIDL
jgi:hypothetical protein